MMGISLSEVSSMHAGIEPDFVDSGLPHDKTLVYYFFLQGVYHYLFVLLGLCMCACVCILRSGYLELCLWV